ncbi:MAG: flavin reductase family protein [Acidobacteriota bacterium]|jgi:flavin reductase (DIM6/NTAB) family NADH-FMN oxidoreductase RutF
MSSTTKAFKEVMRCFAAGVTVVTTRGSGPSAYGVTASSFTSVSLEPRLVLVCLDNRLSGLDQFHNAGRFVVNILAEDQEEVSAHFATPGSDRSERCGYYAQAEGDLPLLANSLAAMECSLETTYPGGDHTILVGSVDWVRRGNRFGRHGPLLYYRGRYARLEPEPITAMTEADRSDL